MALEEDGDKRAEMFSGIIEEIKRYRVPIRPDRSYERTSAVRKTKFSLILISDSKKTSCRSFSALPLALCGQRCTPASPPSFRLWQDAKALGNLVSFSSELSMNYKSGY